MKRSICNCVAFLLTASATTFAGATDPPLSVATEIFVPAGPWRLPEDKDVVVRCVFSPEDFGHQFTFASCQKTDFARLQADAIDKKLNLIVLVVDQLRKDSSRVWPTNGLSPQVTIVPAASRPVLVEGPVFPSMLRRGLIRFEAYIISGQRTSQPFESAEIEVGERE